MAKSEKIERSPAPSVTIDSVYTDQRKATIDKLDQDNPDFVHMYQHENVLKDNSEMIAKGQEFVKNEAGEVIFNGRDPVVRMPRDKFKAKQELDAIRAQNIIESIKDPNEATVFRSPKAPMREKNKPGG